VGMRLSCWLWCIHILSEPVESEGGTNVLSRRACSSGIPWRILTLVERTLHRHRAAFEPQRAWPFKKKVKASKILGEAA
jgi:hypothetical protein